MVERFTPDIERGSSPDYDDPVMRPDEFGGYVRFVDYEAQIAGHRRSAKDATKNLIRATAAEAQLEEMTRSCLAERASRVAAKDRADALAAALDDMLFEYGDKYDSECRLKNASELDMIAKARAALANEEAGR